MPTLQSVVENASCLARISNNRDVEAKAMIVQASIYMNLNQNSLAIDLCRHSWNIYKELGDKQGICKSLIGLGGVYSGTLNEYPQALDAYTTALAIAEELKDTYRIALILGCMGSVYSKLSDYPRALEYMGLALANHEATGAKSFIAQVLKNIGSIYDAVGDYDKALEYTHKALDVFTDLGMKPKIVSIISDIGRLYISTGSILRLRIPISVPCFV
ncbi:MAG: tetratricopeptide repeat protein [Ignavibacteria bacterium]|nr:tetratricopeptide repeat protein [Ignavibacteria bacterium]